MTDKEYMLDILDTEKYISVNMTYALNEASCEKLYKKYFEMFKKINESAKEIFDLAYSKNYYKLESADTKKIKSTYNTLSNSFSESTK